MTGSTRHPTLAALLSFLIPGFGQAYLGQRRLAILLATPVLLLGLGVGIVFAVFPGTMRNELFSARFLGATLIVDVALLGWRLVAIGQAGFQPRAASAGRLRRVGGIGLVVVLMMATAGMHAWAAIVVNRLDSALGNVFSGSRATHAGGGGQAEPINVPTYRWDGTERITFLLLGLDAGPGRQESLTDTILAVSVDPVANTAIMVSVPRDTGFVPLPDTSIYADGLYPQKINQLATDASEAPGQWCPDLPTDEAATCGLRTLERSIGLYLGLSIQYYAQVDLEGFTRLIDAVGGLTLCLPGPMTDPEYTGPGWPKRGIQLPGGCSHYDGVHALAYARIRKGWIDLPDGTRENQNDFKRAARQQTMLLELRRELASADLVFELPKILDALAVTVQTDFPRSMAGDLASLLPLVAGHAIQREVLGYPDYVDPPTNPLVNYLLVPRRDDIRQRMQQLLGPGVQLEGWYLGSQADGPPPTAAAGG